MTRIELKHQSEFYILFQTIPKNSYWQIIRFYEENRDQINELDLEERQTIKYKYLAALFKFKEYHKYARLSHSWLQTFFENGEFDRKKLKTILLNKAISHYRIKEFDNAKKLLLELKKLEPSSDLPEFYLKKVIWSQTATEQTSINGLIVATILILIGILTVYILFIKTLYPQFIQLFVKGMVMLSVMLILFILRKYWVIRNKVYSQSKEIMQNSQ